MPRQDRPRYRWLVDDPRPRAIEIDDGDLPDNVTRLHA